MKTIHQNDRDVFQFILVCTKCDDAHATSVQQMQVHQTEYGGHVFSFKDVEMNVKDQMMLTTTAKKEVVTEPPLKAAAREDCLKAALTLLSLIHSGCMEKKCAIEKAKEQTDASNAWRSHIKNR